VTDRKPQLPSDRVTAELRARIQAGEWQPEERMPSVKQLADELKSSRATVTKALHALEAEGLVVIVQSWGTFRA
jgi:GntR family transcriptional regulator of abcA and norABC